MSYQAGIANTVQGRVHDGVQGKLTDIDRSFSWGIDIRESTGHVYTSYDGVDEVEITDTEGRFIKRFGGNGTANGKFDNIRGLYVDETNEEVYVADRDNDRVQVFDFDGVFVRKFSSTSPIDIAMDEGNSEVYVTNGNASDAKVHVYNRTGTLQRDISTPGDSSGVDFDATNSEVYVTIAFDDTVRVFNTSGTLQRQTGTNLDGITAIHVDEANSEVFVGNLNPDRVNVYEASTLNFKRSIDSTTRPHRGVYVDESESEVYITNSSSASTAGVKVITPTDTFVRQWF